MRSVHSVTHALGSYRSCSLSLWERAGVRATPGSSFWGRATRRSVPPATPGPTRARSAAASRESLRACGHHRGMKFVFLPPQHDDTRAWAAALAKQVPELQVVMAETVEDARREIA